jgi:hypothetical protein
MTDMDRFIDAADALAEAMQSIATWRKAAHDYDEDVGNDPRDFDVSDVQAMEITAERALNRYRAALAALTKKDEADAE